MRAKFHLHVLAVLSLLFVATSAHAQFFLNWELFDYVTDVRQSGHNPSMFIDGNNRIHVSYWNSSTDKLMYKYRDQGSSSWSTEYVDSTELNGHVSSIKVDPQGNVHVAFFQNENKEVHVKYAVRQGANNWNVESLPTTTQYGWGIGLYGPDVLENQTEFIKHSIDLELDSANNPKICFFANYLNTEFIASCGGYYRDYELRLYNAWKDSTGWQIRSFQDIPDRYNNCFGAAPLPRGTRYGEFCSMIIDNQNNPRIFTNTFHNRELMRFDATNDSNWTMFAADSALSIWDSTFLTQCWSWVWQPYFTIESVSATTSEDGSMHAVYTTSINYGKPFMNALNKFNTAVYVQFDPNGNIVQRYQHFPEYPITNLQGTSCDTLPERPYHAYSSVVSRNPDSVYFAVSNRTDRLMILSESLDSGQTWTFDTISDFFGVTESPIQLTGDSIYLLVYDESRDHLRLYRRHLGGGAWAMEQLTYSQRQGVNMDAVFGVSGADTLMHMVYVDDYNDGLYYGRGTLNGTMTWLTEQLDSNNSGFDYVRIVTRPTNGDPYIVYNRNGGQEFVMAYRNGGSWTYEVIDDSLSSFSGDILIGQDDSIRVVFSTNDLSVTEHPIIYQARDASGGGWTWEEIRTEWPVADTVDYEGGYPRIALDSQGNTHVSFHDLRDRSLNYAKLTNGSGWQKFQLEWDSTASLGKWSSIEISPADEPNIAYVNDVSEHLKWAEPDTGSSWSLETLDTTDVTRLGIPSQLVFGATGEPWIAYNFYNGLNGVRFIFRKDSVWNTTALASSGQIGSAFAFGSIGKDVYIAGKKNEPNNTGIAVMRSKGALSVERIEDLPEAVASNVVVYPNPTTGNANIRFELNATTETSVSLIDSYGRIVKTWRDGQIRTRGMHEMALDLGGISDGFYFLVLETETAKINRKIIISR